MNTVGTGNVVAGTSSGGEFIFDPIYTESMKSNVSDIKSATIVNLSGTDSSKYPYYASASSYWCYGMEYWNGCYYAVNQTTSSDTSSHPLYRYSFAKDSSGKYVITVTALSSLANVTGMCRIGDRLLVSGYTTKSFNGTSDCFYIFDGTSFTKISNSILTMIGISPNNGNADSVPWRFFPLVNDDLTFTGTIYGYTAFPGWSSDYSYTIMAFFQYDESNGTISKIKSQYTSWYYLTTRSTIVQQMGNITFMNYHSVNKSPVVFMIGLDRFIKLEYKSGTKQLRIALFKWDWYKEGNYNGSNDTLTIIKEELVDLPNSVTSGFIMSVEPLSYPGYDSYSILISHYVENSSYSTTSSIDEILVLTIMNQFDFRAVRAEVPFSKTVLFDETDNKWLVKHRIQLYNSQPYIMILLSRSDRSTFSIIDINFTGDINANGSRYMYNSYFHKGDVVYCDDGIISVLTPEGIEVTYDSIRSMKIDVTGQYTFTTISSNPYIRPAFVIKTSLGQLLHLGMEKVSETDIKGYFIKDMKVSGQTISNSGLQTIQNAIVDGRTTVTIK